MHQEQEVPLVSQQTTVKEALFEITDKKLGITGVIDPSQGLIGVFTDGDLRRCLEDNVESLELSIVEVMSHHPKRVLRHNLAAKAVKLMEEFSVTSLFVFEQENDTTPVGIVHLHDLLKAGVV